MPTPRPNATVAQMITGASSPKANQALPLTPPSSLVGSETAIGKRVDRTSGVKPALVPLGDSNQQAAFVAQRILERRGHIALAERTQALQDRLLQAPFVALGPAAAMASASTGTSTAGSGSCPTAAMMPITPTQVSTHAARLCFKIFHHLRSHNTFRITRVIFYIGCNGKLASRLQP